MRTRATLAFLLIGTLALARRLRGRRPRLLRRERPRRSTRACRSTIRCGRSGDAGLAAHLAALVDQAQSGDAAFNDAAAIAERLASAAGAPQSESWIAAQQALSAAQSARGPTTRALGDIDGLGSTALATKGGLSAGGPGRDPFRSRAGRRNRPRPGRADQGDRSAAWEVSSSAAALAAGHSSASIR